MISGIVFISIFAGIATSALVFYALKASWGFSMAEFYSVLAELVAVPGIRRDPELQPLVDLLPVTDRSCSVFIVYSLMEVSQTQDIASVREGNYAIVTPEGHPHDACKFYLN